MFFFDRLPICLNARIAAAVYRPNGRVCRIANTAVLPFAALPPPPPLIIKNNGRAHCIMQLQRARAAPPCALRDCNTNRGAIIAVRTAAFLLRFLLPSISIARHYRRRLYPALSLSRRRRITGGGVSFAAANSSYLPPPSFKRALSTALLPAQLSPCARRRFFCGFFCRHYRRRFISHAFF